MTYEFTERTAIIFSRWIKIQLPKVMKAMEAIKVKEHYNKETFEQNYSLRCHGWIAVFSIYMDNIDDEDDCSDYDYDSAICIVDIKKWNEKSCDRNVSCLGDPTKKDMLEELRKMIGSYHYCECQSIVKVGTFCDVCAPFILPHPNNEDCAICLDKQESVWIQTDCSHIFHRKCWNKIENTKLEISPWYQKKCPLCRKLCDTHPEWV
jgi:hypothetical protein